MRSRSGNRNPLSHDILPEWGCTAECFCVHDLDRQIIAGINHGIESEAGHCPPAFAFIAIPEHQEIDIRICIRITPCYRAVENDLVDMDSVPLLCLPDKLPDIFYIGRDDSRK